METTGHLYVLGLETTHPFHTRPFLGEYRRWAQAAQSKQANPIKDGVINNQAERGASEVRKRPAK
jgi:hypothetical protein